MQTEKQSLLTTENLQCKQNAIYYSIF